MMKQKSDMHLWQKTDYLILAASFIPAAAVTWGMHEGAHWLTGRALGYEM